MDQATKNLTSPKPYWFVGAAYNGTEDQSEHFIKSGIWQNGRKDKKTLDKVRSIQPGDKIAIKSGHTQKYGLPFDNRGKNVSVFKIKAIGVVTKNQGDGRSLDVDWEPRFNPPKKWYFYTNRFTVWKVVPGSWEADNLIDFTFNEGVQNIDRFLNDPKRKEQFGDRTVDNRKFFWTDFYQAVADGLIAYQENRYELTRFIKKLPERSGLKHVRNLDDIDPFTVMGLFNLGLTPENTKAIAQEFSDFLNIGETVPDSFEGLLVPTLDPRNPVFFDRKKAQNPDDIASLWNFFGKALQFSDSNYSNAKEEFKAAYNKVRGQHGVNWNLTMALFWIRPWSFPSLDNNSREYITKKLGISGARPEDDHLCDADNYLKVLYELKQRFNDETCPVHSFPELSLAAYEYKDDRKSSDDGTAGPDHPAPMLEGQKRSESPAVEPYSIKNIIADGSFLGEDTLASILERLKEKKNLILQGPPGTGKTWLARRLTFALMGQRDEKKLCAVQFHPNLSYEDLVRGWRPSGEGKLALIDGPFLKTVSKAREDAEAKYVLLIEEINRGNPAQIFGEMLTLIEADKRNPSEALELSYRYNEEERIYVPDNFYIIGTMNIADRSLASLDLALRRRFAFVDLKPAFGETWRNYLHQHAGIDLRILREIESRLNNLNKQIEEDERLGAQSQIGHSYVTPPSNLEINDPIKWYKNIVETEIGPLLDEYWFNDRERAREARNDLIANL